MSRLLKALLTTSLLTLPVALGGELALVNSNHASPSTFSSIERLPLDCIKTIIGSVVIPKSNETVSSFYIGYLSLNNLAHLARCKNFRPLVQPILDHANAWRKSGVITRSLSSSIPLEDYIMASLFLGSCINEDAFTLAVYIPTDNRINPSEDIDALITNSTFTPDQKYTLGCIARDALQHLYIFVENITNMLRNLPDKDIAISALKYLLSKDWLLSGQKRSALALVDLGEKESAVSILENVVYSSDTNTHHLLGCANALNALGKKNTAIEVCKKIITISKSAPVDLYSLTLTADFLFDLDEKTLASELCHEVLNHPETEYLRLNDCRRVFEKLNEISTVIAIWHRIKKFSNQSPWVLVDSAVAFEELGEKDAALESSREVLNHPTPWQSNLYKIAKVLERLGDNASAITAWEKILDQAEVEQYTFKEAAEALERLDDTAFALIAWKRVLDLDNISINILKDAAYNLERLGDTALAILACKRLTQYPVEQCWAYILHIVPSLVRLGEKNSAISFCHRFFCDETTSQESLEGAVFSAKFLERLDALPSAISMWKTLLNHPQATVDQLVHAFLSFYFLDEKPLAIKACYKILDHPDTEPWILDYTADAFIALDQHDSTTKPLYRILSHPDSVKVDYDRAIRSLKKIEKGQSLNLDFLHELVQYNKTYWDKVFTSKDGIIEEEEELPVIIESFPNWVF